MFKKYINQLQYTYNTKLVHIKNLTTPKRVLLNDWLLLHKTVKFKSSKNNFVSRNHNLNYVQCLGISFICIPLCRMHSTNRFFFFLLVFS